VVARCAHRERNRSLGGFRTEPNGTAIDPKQRAGLLAAGRNKQGEKTPRAGECGTLTHQRVPRQVAIRTPDGRKTGTCADATRAAFVGSARSTTTLDRNATYAIRKR